MLFLRRVEYFLVLAEVLNFHKAADIVCISTSALSRQIALLEDELGGELFKRTTKSVQLTENGRLAYKEFQDIKQNWDNAVNRLQEQFILNPGTLTVGFFYILPKPTCVNPILLELSSKFPNYRIKLISGEMSELHRMLLDREVDFLITGTNDAEDWSGCQILKYKSFPFKIAVSPSHPWSTKKEISITDIEEGSILLLDDNKYLLNDCVYNRIKTKEVIRVTDFNALLSSLEFGKQFSIFPQQFNGVSEVKLKFFDLPEQLKDNSHVICACHDSKKDFVKMLDCISESLKTELVFF